MEKSVWKWITAPLFDWTVIISAITFAAYFNTFWSYFIAVFFIGARQHALGLAGHEGTHGAICADIRKGDILAGAFCWWPLAVFADGYRAFHLSHHKHMGTKRDPELNHKAGIFWNWSLPMSKTGMAKMLLFDLTLLNVEETLMIFKIIGLPRSRMDIYGPMGWWITVVTALYFSLGLIVTAKILVLWNISLLTAFLASFRLRLWTEHLGTDGVYKIKAGFMPRFFFLPHNTWYHFEHHANMRVPFWKLPEMRCDGEIETIYAVLRRHLQKKY